MLNLTRTALSGTLMLALALSLVPSANAAEVTTYTPSRIEWTELDYRASKLGVKADSDVRIELKSAETAKKDFIEPEAGMGVMPDEDQVAHLWIESLVKGKESQVDLWLDTSSAAALQMLSVERSDKRNVYKNYRFLENSAHLVRREPPNNKDNKGDASEWPLVRERDFPFPANLSGGRAVSEASALFYVLSAADFREVGDKVVLYGFDRDGMAEIVLEFVELKNMKVQYTEVSPGGEKKISGSKEVARVTLSGKAVEAGSEFAFLGLQGEIEIYVDPELRVPISVVGRVPIAGKTTVKLTRVKIK